MPKGTVSETPKAMPRGAQKASQASFNFGLKTKKQD